MVKTRLIITCLAGRVSALVSAASAVDIETVPVGNAGNANDTHGAGRRVCRRRRRGTALGLLVALAFLAGAAPGALAGPFPALDWNLFYGGAEDMEFGITRSVAGTPTQEPWAFESGYDGAYLVDGAGLYKAWGQPFQVDAQSTLVSATLRVSRATTAAGTFEVSVFDFDPATHRSGDRLAHVADLAQNYLIGLSGVPQSTFDMSSFGVELMADRHYLLVLSAGDDLVGNVYAQSAANIYAGGAVHYRTELIPEPATLSLLAVGGLMLIRRKRKR